jgi:F-type H+-transporting ATPase subunit a
MINNIYNISNINLINSPLEQFEVSNLISINAPLLGYLNITLSNLALYSIIVFILIIAIHFLGNNETKILPSK